MIRRRLIPRIPFFEAKCIHSHVIPIAKKDATRKSFSGDLIIRTSHIAHCTSHIRVFGDLPPIGNLYVKSIRHQTVETKPIAEVSDPFQTKLRRSPVDSYESHRRPLSSSTTSLPSLTGAFHRCMLPCHGMSWHGMAWHGMIPRQSFSEMIRYDTVRYGTTRYDTIRYHNIPSDPYDTVSLHSIEEKHCSSAAGLFGRQIFSTEV
mmetsp:Transcript_4350/g.12511  ORF Transcript_4350/g.12511 Transcript_4350/m.12511 type:complete len:205 (-) Transcript_4350:3881-4495(-)